MPIAIRLEKVSVSFRDKRVLEDISLEVAQGECVVLVGPSGAGKSTLLGVINGTVLPERGRVWLLGHDIGRLSPGERQALCCQVGTIYQDLCLVDSLRVIHNVNAGNLGRWTTLRSLWSLLWPLERARVRAALERVGIPEKIYERTATLSGGQQQRVAIARLLVQDPAVVLADEPISSLDPQRSREAMQLLRGLNQDLHKTVVVSCHSVEFARSHFDRVVGIQAGRVSFDCAQTQVTNELLDGLYASQAIATNGIEGVVNARADS